AKTVIWRWQERFRDEGAAGLWRDKTRRSRIPPLSPEVAKRVVALTLAGPPPAASHWTGSAMAKAAGISVSSVQRIWRAHGLQPHRVRQFKLSNDPQFAAKLHEIVGLYVNPPSHAIVIAVGLAAHRGPEAGGLHHLALVRRGILNASIGTVDQAGARPLPRDGHLQRCQRQVGAQMIRHRPADDPAAVEVHDGGQIKPALIGLDIGDVGEPDPVRRGGKEVSTEQVRSDREAVAAVGGPHPAWPRHDSPDPVMAHQSLNAT